MRAVRAARRLPRLTIGRRERSASGVTPCVSGEKRGFSPVRGERPAGSFSVKLDGAAVRSGIVFGSNIPNETSNLIDISTAKVCDVRFATIKR